MSLKYRRKRATILTTLLLLNTNILANGQVLKGEEALSKIRLTPYDSVSYYIDMDKTELYPYHTSAWNYSINEFSNIEKSGIGFEKVYSKDNATIEMTSTYSQKEEWLGLSSNWYYPGEKYNKLQKSKIQMNEYTINEYSLSREHIYQVALHEMGHSFGLVHQPQQYSNESIMAPYLSANKPPYPHLTSLDKENIRSAYPIIKLNDWENHWAKEQIQIAMDKGWLDNSSTFRPNESINRAEFVKVFNRVFGLTNTSGKTFDDTINHWAKTEIDIAVTNGVCQGTSQTTFSPNDPIQREQAAKMIANYLKIDDLEHDKIMTYPDYHQISIWARDALEGTIEQGYIKGYLDTDNNQIIISPKKSLTRAEAVVMLSRINTKSKEYSATYIIPETTTYLENKSTTIVKGKFTGNRYTDTDESTVGPLTVSRFEINKIYKGDLIERTISVLEPFEIENTQISSIQGYTPMMPQEEYILFLRENNTQYGKQYTILSMNYGKYETAISRQKEPFSTPNLNEDMTYNELKKEILSKYN